LCTSAHNLSVCSYLELTWLFVARRLSWENNSAANSAGKCPSKYPNIKKIDYEASLSNLQHENATLRQENEKFKQVAILAMLIPEEFETGLRQ
jgi:hypothetical protein